MSSDDATRSAWLVLRAQAGDRPALDDLLALTQRLLSPYLNAVAGDADEAADVMQEVLLTVYRKLHKLREPRAYLAWARRIASRTLVARLKALKQWETSSAALDDTIAAEAGDDPLPEALVPGILAQISPASREVLALRYLSGLTLREIAATLDLPLGTVKSRLGYGLQSLRRLLRREPDS